MRSLWLGLGMALVGGLALHGAGCSGSNNNNNGGVMSGGACCLCASTVCTNMSPRVISATDPGATISDCKAFCQSKYLATCTDGNQSTVTGVGVNCPPDAGASTGMGGSPGTGGSNVNGMGGSAGRAGAAGGATGGAGAGGGSVSDASGATAFGSACAQDADCGGNGLRCSRTTDSDTFPGFGIPNGLCTKSCTATTDCAPLGGTCVVFSNDPAATGVCFQLCDLGTPAVPAQKCRGRLDVACTPLQTTIACLPMCATDADCGGTRRCDIFSGFCADANLVAPTPIGAACTQDEQCGGGFCLQFNPPPDGGPSPGFCSGACRLSTSAGEACGYRRTAIDAGPGPVGVCAFRAITGAGTGDLGFCGQLCDSDADCSAHYPGWICDLTAVPFYNHGLCFLAADAGVPQ